MDKKSMRKWSEFSGLPVTIPSEGRRAGMISDFYFKTETNSIYALQVRTPISEERALPVSAILSIEANAITIANEFMLMTELPPFPQSEQLLGRIATNEQSTPIGKVSEVWLGVKPLVALHIAALTITDNNDRHAYLVSADAVTSYTLKNVVIRDQIARRLR